jgi:hypothetical protein
MAEQFQNILVQCAQREGDLLREVERLDTMITMERAASDDLAERVIAETTDKLTTKHKAVVRSPNNGPYTACR